MFKSYKEILLSLNFNQKLFIWAIVVMSIDGFPFLPINSDNRPISIIFLIIYWSSMKVKIPNLFKFEIVIFLIFIVLWLFTLINSVFVYHDFKGLNKFTITGFFASLTICSCLLFYKSIIDRFSPKELLHILSSCLIFASFIPIGVGIIQFCAIKNILPLSIADIITNFFSYRPLQDRIQMLNSEASHAANYMILVFFFTYSFFDIKKKQNRQILFIVLLMFILISSTIGYATFAITLFFYWLFCIKKNIQRLVLYFVSIVGVVGILFALKDYILTEYTLQKFQILSDLTSLDSDIISAIVAVDFSTYDRIFSPILGIYSLHDTYFLGTGGESFFYHYEYYVNKYLPFALDNQELKKHLDNGTMLTIKFLPLKILAEFGVIPFLGFCSLFTHFFKKLLTLKKETNNNIYDGLSLILMYAITSTWACSYFSFNFILMMTLIYTMTLNKNKLLTDKRYAN
jgi:hypothetical protein